MHHNLGTLLEEQGQFGAAEKCYRRAIQANPEIADCHWNLGDLLENKINDLKGAEAAYSAAVAADPEDAEAREAVLRVRTALAARTSKDAKGKGGRKGKKGRGRK